MTLRTEQDIRSRIDGNTKTARAIDNCLEYRDIVRAMREDFKSRAIPRNRFLVALCEDLERNA